MHSNIPSSEPVIPEHFLLLSMPGPGLLASRMKPNLDKASIWGESAWKVRYVVLERSAPLMRDDGHLSALKLSSKIIGGKTGVDRSWKHCLWMILSTFGLLNLHKTLANCFELTHWDLYFNCLLPIEVCWNPGQDVYLASALVLMWYQLVTLDRSLD